MSRSVLEVKNLSKHYKKFKLDEVSFSLREGEITGLIGPNGSGKSTTMKLLLSAIEKTSGEMLFLDETVTEINKMTYKSEVGYVGEDTDFFLNQKCVHIKNYYKLFYENWDECVYNHFMDSFDLSDDYRMKELSKGMRVKFSLALALSHKPKLLLMDEPTSGLDPIVRSKILDVLRAYANDEKASILFSSHITEDMSKIADRLLFIYKGKLVKKADTQTFVENNDSIDNYLKNMIEEEDKK